MAQDGTAGGVNVSGSMGVVAGSGNTQVNNWQQKPPLNPASLRALNPHTAVARLQGLSHDDLVDLFAGASPEDVAEVLGVWLEADEAPMVAVLADINPHRSRDLIAPLAADTPWLEALPRAAVAIGARARELKWGPNLETGHVRRADQSAMGSTGYFLKYENGLIYWSDRASAHALTGQIAKYHEDKGGTGGELGFPLGDEAGAQESPLGTTGVQQHFEGGIVYASGHGACLVTGDIREHHHGLGGTAGWLGFPVEEVTGDDDGRSMQVFEGGACFDLHGHTTTVRLAVVDYLDETGVDEIPGEVADDGEDDEVDIDDESAAPDSPFGTSGLKQVFTAAGPNQFCVYTTEKHGIHLTAGTIREYHDAIGGTGSWLGFPKGDVTESRQDFEGGTVYAGEGRDPVAVPAATMELLSEDSPPWGPLGFPVSAEKVVAPAEDESVQFFANGIVTLRDGKREIWLRHSPASRRIPPATQVRPQRRR